MNVPDPVRAEEVEGYLKAIAEITNDGPLPEGAWYREWDIPRTVAPAQIAAAVRDFAAEVFRRWGEIKSDPVPLAAWAERTLNAGRLRPTTAGNVLRVMVKPAAFYTHEPEHQAIIDAAAATGERAAGDISWSPACWRTWRQA